MNKNIIVLTYHEITEDPRILKQSRALVSAGYDVHVFCSLREEFRENEVLDGIHVHRFDCYSHKQISKSAIDFFDFLDLSKEHVKDHFLPYAEMAEADSSHYLALMEFLGEEELKKLQKAYYKDKRGFRRVRRKFTYYKTLLRVKWGILSWFPKARTRQKWAAYKASRKQVSGLFRNLQHARGLVYGINLLHQPLPVKPSIIHCHDIYTLPGAVCLAARQGAKLIYDAHEYEPARAVDMGEKERELGDLLELDCLHHVDRLITVSPHIGRLYEKRYKGPKPEIIFNSPEICTFPSPSADGASDNQFSIRRAINAQDTTPIIVFTGHVLGNNRGLDKALEALALLPDFRFVIMGPRQKRNDRWLLKHAERLNVKDRLFLLPSIEAHEVPSAISTADVALCPIQDTGLSYRYALPNKLFEAAFAGIPLCVSDLPEMRAFVERLGIGEVTDQTAPARIANTLEYIFNNKQKYSMTPEAERILHDEYSWHAQKKKLISIYTELSDQ